MNVLLWILQVALAVLSLAGGAYKVFSFDAVANQPFFGALPRSGWGALGAFEMLCAVLLVVPAAAKWMPILTPLAAAALDTVESVKLYFKTPVAARGSILNGLLNPAKASTAFRSRCVSLSGCNG
jgi:DoxX-like protein